MNEKFHNIKIKDTSTQILWCETDKPKVWPSNHHLHHYTSLTVEGVGADTPQDKGEQNIDDIASSPPTAPSPRFREGLSCLAWLLSGLGGLELSEPL